MPSTLHLHQAYDTWFFWVHRYAHINKWLFRYVHAKHHRNDAYLSVTSNSFEHPIDGLLVVGIPVGFIAWFGLWTGNWWMLFVPMHTIACIFVFGEYLGPGSTGERCVAGHRDADAGRSSTRAGRVCVRP